MMVDPIVTLEGLPRAVPQEGIWLLRLPSSSKRTPKRHLAVTGDSSC